MTDSANPHILAVRVALTAIDQAFDDEEKRLAMCALSTAGGELDLAIQARYAWLMRNDLRLTEYEETLLDDEFTAKEAIYLEKLTEYEDMVNCLADATGVINLPVPVSRTLAQEQQVEML